MWHEELYSPHGGPRYLSTIPVKDSHLFKITKSVFSFYLKSTILNKWEYFIGMLDHITYPPWRLYNFSCGTIITAQDMLTCLKNAGPGFKTMDAPNTPCIMYYKTNDLLCIVIN